MRYVIKATLLLVIGLADFACQAGQELGSYPCPTFNLKRHQFGVGISTAMCDHALGVNQYLVRGWEQWGMVNQVHISTYHSTYFTLFFDYQYRFNDSWSIESRLKYKRRYTESAMSIRAQDVNARLASIIFTYHDIAVPVTCNYRWVTRAGASIELFAGVGVTTLGLAGMQSFEFHYNDIYNTHGILKIEYDRGLDVFGILGIQFDIPFGSFCLKPYVSYSYSPIRYARFVATPAEATPNFSKEIISAPLHLSELEIGLIMHF